MHLDALEGAGHHAVSEHVFDRVAHDIMLPIESQRFRRFDQVLDAGGRSTAPRTLREIRQQFGQTRRVIDPDTPALDAVVLGQGCAGEGFADLFNRVDVLHAHAVLGRAHDVSGDTKLLEFGMRDLTIRVLRVRRFCFFHSRSSFRSRRVNLLLK